MGANKSVPAALGHKSVLFCPSSLPVKKIPQVHVHVDTHSHITGLVAARMLNYQ